ncbi:5'-3' exonuclease PLD3 [Thalassophryne amazonica]|uniref:5'-3' exonuclease PLD3 n=1 Tax=Thalassophryne amazonica TaxID=390379 RepID=UPI00147191FB|nr:5'-3' exonuclease PLD3 [Thalassophryne amazonica]
MPMVLRSRKSRTAGESAEEPRPRSRTHRPHGKVEYEAEDTDGSDSEVAQSTVMETLRSLPAEQQEEEDVAEIRVPELKDCTVVLHCLESKEDTSKELEDKEDMSHKGGKSVSRIPTFQKRIPLGTHTSEIPVFKRDALLTAGQPPEMGGSEDVLKSKPSVRETALPLPSVRVPKISFDASSPFSIMEQTGMTAYGLASTPKSKSDESESAQHYFMAVTPRPALRPEQGSDQYLTEKHQSSSTQREVDKTLDDPISHHSVDGSIWQKPHDDAGEKFDADVDCGISLGGSGAGGKTEFLEIVEKNEEPFQLKAIMDEEPPWKTDPLNEPELKEDNGSSSDSQSEDDLMVEQSGVDSGGCHLLEPHASKGKIQSDFSDPVEESTSMEESTSPARPMTPLEAKSTKRSSCWSFAYFWFLPTTFLLLGGFGQHVWHYGLPLSVAQFTDHLQLHWLEGFGFVMEPCSSDCRVQLVESIPDGLHPSGPPYLQSIADRWLSLLDKAHNSVHISAFYLTLRATDLGFSESSDSQGRKVFEQLKQLESKGVTLQIAVNAPQTSTQDTAELAATGADVKEVDLHSVTGGIIHTKLWVVDQKHLYLGSANMDWRSLTQVKEVGLSVEDCSCLAQDAFRIFGVYWSIGGGKNGSLPPYWPARFSALSSAHHPLHLKFNGVPAQVYLSSAPPEISARGRSDDLTTILSVIADAQKFIYVSVMDYLPLSQFVEPLRFWPAIDSALRAAACTRGVQVKLLVSCWEHSPASMFIFLQSLVVLNRHPLSCDVQIKVFTVPSTAEQKKIPFARVSHAKYMVTDRVLYIGTSNWSENYFTQTAGVGLVVNQTGSVVGKDQRTLQGQAEELFLRDWTSEYARLLTADDLDICPRGRH